MQPDIDLRLLAPEIALSVTLLVVLVADTFLPKERKRWSMFIGLAGVLVALGFVIGLAGESASTLGGAFVIGGPVLPIKGFFLLVGAATLVMSLRYVDDEISYQGEYYFLLLCSLLGCLFMPSARDLITLFIAIELVSAPVFLMAAFRKKELKSNEAGLKFFIFGVLSSAVMLYGMSLVYGLTGVTNVNHINETFANGSLGTSPAALAAVLMVAVGFGFKVSAVPFHFWAPDTYEGAPLPVVAFLSVASKAAGFVGLAIVMGGAFLSLAEFWTPIFAVLSILTMTLGNLVALQQKQLVRLMAYSSIAQAGYILLPFALTDPNGSLNEQIVLSIFVYVFIYAVMNLGLFAVIIGMDREAPDQKITDYSGLLKRSPAFAVAMVAFLISLAGIPPMAGFWAKFFVFKVAIEAGGAGPALAAAMVVNSVIGLYYYLAVAKQVVLREGDQTPVRIAPSIVAVVGVAAALILAVGVYPDLFAKFLN